jgi:glyoxylase-like metal-dependent hydrolase (beta-lactamase superfamily II)
MTVPQPQDEALQRTEGTAANVSVQTTMLGGVSLSRVHDCAVMQPTAEFFPHVREKDWRTYLNGAPNVATLTFPVAAWLLRAADRTILIDTGVGDGATPHPVTRPRRLPANLIAAGVHPDEVDVVVLTHLHWDHTGWNTVARDDGFTPLFTRARYLVQRAEWHHWTATEERRRTVRYARSLRPLEEAGQLQLVDGAWGVADGFDLLPVPGHTPGHACVRVASADTVAYIVGDALHHAAQISHPQWCSRADLDPARAAASRLALLQRIAAEGALLASSHLPAPGIGRVAAAKSGFRFHALP